MGKMKRAPDVSKSAASLATEERATKLPSRHLAELSLSLGERLALESRNKRPVEIVERFPTAGQEFTVNPARPIFQPYPTAIILQNFTPFETYEVVLTFRNMDKFTRQFRVEPPVSPFFEITRWETESLYSGRIASGMEVSFVVRFTPEERKDYAYDLICLTEREKFIVPVRAIGARAILDFPDVINFPESAVAHTTKKTMLVRNVGNSPAKFVIETDGPFTAIPSYGYLDVNANMQLDIAFTPERVGSFNNELTVKYHSGEQVNVRLIAQAEDADIRLEQNLLQLDHTYITRASMKTIRIMNRSDIMAHFQWKKFATDFEEDQFRYRHQSELDEEEKIERNALAKYGSSSLTDICLLSRRYKNKHRDVERNKMLFDDDILTIEPVEGNIYPNSCVDITVIFRPVMASVHNQTIFCQVSGREIRLPLQITGEGIGPNARFSYDLLDIEDVFIDSKHRYEVVMENQGDIPANYRLEPSCSLFGPKFQFSPSAGRLDVGEDQRIEITFCSNILGEFSEDFVWRLEGSPQLLLLGVRGRVMGPTFTFDRSELDFGTVSYKFSYTNELKLTNTSVIRMAYQLRIPGDGNEGVREFNINPASGALAPGASARILVEFTPSFARSYECSLVVDIEGVGEDVHQLPILGESVVPMVTLRTPLLDYGDCFLCSVYTRAIELSNETEYPARYSFRAQEPSAKAVYSYSSAQSSGVIEPRSVKRVGIDVEIKRVGSVSFPVFVTIAGNEDEPLCVDISACGQGPNVILSAHELNWGKVNVLKETPLTLSVHNDSPIPAPFTCSTISETSMFRLSPQRGVIAPAGREDICVTAYLDDCLKFTDILRFAIQSGALHEVQLVARGQGSTITYQPPLETVDFGNVFSSRVCNRQFRMVNKGRRAQTLHWLVPGQQGYPKQLETQEEPANYFEVVPSRFSLKPGAEQAITIHGFSETAGLCKETLICQATLEKDPTRKTIVESLISANFINPLVSLSPPSLRFLSTHTEDDDFRVLSQNFTLKNVSSLPLHVCFKCPRPYSLNPPSQEHYLKPEETLVLGVSFDPSYKTDRVSCTERAKMAITYAEHPQKDSVELYSKVVFPNLSLSTNGITFECSPLNMERRSHLVMTNTGELPVHFSWSFLDDDRLKFLPAGDWHGWPGWNSGDISKVFDIMPLHGLIPPGHSQRAEVTFYGHHYGRFTVAAVCDVVGGPKYEVALAGESSSIGYQLDTQVLDFGVQSYQEIAEKDVILRSTGRVAFNFQVIIPENSVLSKRITVSPASGKISPFQEQRLVVRFCPCIPDTVEDSFFVRISYFSPAKVVVKGSGTFPRISINMPRLQDELDAAALSETRRALHPGAGGRSADAAKSEPPPESAAAAAPDAEPEVEAEAARLVLREKTMLLLDELRQNFEGGAAQHALKDKTVGSPILAQYTQTRVGKDKKVISFLSELSKARVATYVCDLGNVVKNTTKKKTAVVTNCGDLPVTFTFDRAVLAGTGFSVEPEKVKNLPARQSVEFTVNIVTRNLEASQASVDLPLMVAGGPQVILALRAFITIPDIRVSSSNIQFGDIICGHRKTFVLQLSNTNCVPAEWTSTVTPVDNQNQDETGMSLRAGKGVRVLQPRGPAKDARLNVSSVKEFDVVPASGTVAAGASCNVFVRLSPTESRVYEALLTIKVNMNNRPISIPLRGQAVRLGLAFEPEVVTMGPILPYAEAAEARFVAHNPTDYALEMYSVEFDEQHLQEEEVLRKIDGYENGVVHIPPREPGRPLPPHLTELASWKVQNEKAASGVAGDAGAPFPTLAASEGVGELLDPLRNVRKQVPAEIQDAQAHLPPHVIFHGPPLSGKTTQAKKIAALCGHTAIRIDDVVDAALHDQSGAYGEVTARLQEFVQWMQDEKMAERHHYRAPNPDASAGEDFGSHSVNMPEDLFLDVMRVRLQMPDSARGYVIDGLDSKYTPNVPMVLRLLLKILVEKRKTVFFNFSLDTAQMNARESAKQKAAEEHETQMIQQVKEISEEQYDRMSEADKEAYDRALSTYKRQKKELERKRDEEKRRWEEEIAARNERKADEERQNKKNKGRRAPPAPKEKTDRSASTSTRTSRININLASSDKLSSPARLKGERDRGIEDETSSRAELEDLGDALLPDHSYKQYEIYVRTLDAVSAMVKEGDKPAKAGNPEKKPSKAAKQQYNDTHAADEAEHTDETSNVLAIDLNANQEEAAVTQALLAEVPQLEIGPAGQEDAAPPIRPPFSEHVVIYPQERVAPTINQFFSLSPNTVPETDEPSSTGENGLSSLNIKEAIREEGKGKKGRSAAKPVEDTRPVPVEEGETDHEVQKPYRWILQPRERKELVVRFCSSEVGVFEQTLSFEIVGTRGVHNMRCVGHCQYAQIVSEPRKLFSKCRKSKEDQAIVRGEYVLSSATYEFGPLLCTKPREKYQEKFPENRAVFNVINPMPFDIKVMFALKHDVKSEVFFFDPSSMDLPAGQSAELSLWAYPKTSNRFEDMLICCVKDNPEPYLYKFSCIGVRPELEVDKKSLSFDKLLFNRPETRELKFRNSTLLPISWKIVGVDSLGEEFRVEPLDGIIEPLKEQVVTARFMGTKPVVVKRMVRLEAADTDKVSGVVQTENILVTAEAYDVSMEVHCPKGTYTLDFGVLRVGEEGKQVCTIKNKGKYEVGYKFALDTKDLSDLFTISPQHGVIQPSDKPFPVQIMFRATRELGINSPAGLRCVTFEPSTGEVINQQDIRLIARAVFSKFSVMPARDLNFGALVHGNKATRQFVIENLGEFEFRFGMSKLLQGTDSKVAAAKLRAGVRISKGAKVGAETETPKTVNRKEALGKADAASFGPFAVFPINGVINPGGKQQITVEFHAEAPGSFEEAFALDISERSLNDASDATEYRLLGESCIPGVNTTDFPSIFEEHTVVKRLELFTIQGNVYAEEDRVFYFGPLLAGQQSQVRFKISNPYKVPCDVTLSVKTRNKTAKGDTSDLAFDVEPKRLSIPSHEHRYVTASFHPTSMQSYSGLFEAMVENADPKNNRSLSFELRGEGTLPRVFVEKPTVKTKQGVPILKFKRLLVGTSQTSAILLRNDGIIPAKVRLDWAQRESDDFKCSATATAFFIRPQESQTVEIVCRPGAVKRIDAELRMKVMDNSFEDTSILVQGEGYIDDITFDDLPNAAETEISFGDCAIGESKTIPFAVSNHSVENVRVSWSELQDFTITPSVAHIMRKSSKDFKISYTAKSSSDLKHVLATCKVSKIRYIGPMPDADWDDRTMLVRWVAGDPAKSGQRKTLEMTPEPPYEVIGATKDYHLTVTAFADHSQFECDTERIIFKSTLMYQTRVFRFTLRNSGRVRLHFDFSVVEEDGGQLVDVTETSPFSVEPRTGVIEAGDSTLIAVHFTPIEVGNYESRLACNIPNLHPDHKPLDIYLAASSLRPFCHFELEQNDYLTSERRNTDNAVANGMPSFMDPATRVIEFGSCGIKVRNTKRFYIVNPTSMSYEFEWSCDIADDVRNSVFKCLTPRGLVLSGKKFENVFEYTPEVVDVREALWRFTIPGHKIVVPFLLVGQAVEPNVYMDRASINFKSLLVGRQVRETVRLMNNENIPFSFAFSETSLEVDNDGTPVLRFSPTSGTVGPRSEAPIDITFKPPSEKVFNFNLICNVRKKPTSVTINVKGEGYEIHETIHGELSDGTPFDLVSGKDDVNILDFGQVQINEKRIKRITVANSGKFNFDFVWKFHNKSRGVISVQPEIGTVSKGERLICEIAYMPLVVATLKNVRLTCQITNGRPYHLLINGSGVKPLLSLSTTAVNFGTAYIYFPGMKPPTRMLQITNGDVKDIAFDIQVPESTAFDLPRGPHILSPGSVMDVPIEFFPREPVKYHDMMWIEINGLSKVCVDLQGQGAECRVELANPEHRIVNFGAVRVGHVISRSVRVINKSTIPATFSLGAAGIEALQGHSVTVAPAGECTLRPKGIASFEFTFRPSQRIPTFAEEVIISLPGFTRPLTFVSGACQGVEIHLESDTLPFGAVVLKSSATRRVQLQNTGDIGVKFKWNAANFLPDFSISPSDGYISPGMDIPLEVTFHPQELNQDIRYDSLCCQTDAGILLSLTLTGMCVPPQTNTEVIKFATPVRQSDMKGITLTNKTSTHWHIRPVIDNDEWSGAETLDVPPGGSEQYNLTFTPLSMSSDAEYGKHEGSIFFPLPDGGGIQYKLSGWADKPTPAGMITREVPCKTNHIELLATNNWLKRSQRFTASIEVAKPDPSTILKGLDYIDVPGLQTRDYKLSFYAYKEMVTTAKVIFTNESTGEFLFYNLTFKSTPPGISGTLEMSTPVRQALTKEVTISNPLNVHASFTTSCNNPDVSLPHSFTIQPKSEGSCTIEYLPLQPKETTARVCFTGAELGLYQYDLKLASTPAGAERSLHFKVPLGGSQSQTFRFLSYSKTRTDYTCRVDNPDYSVDKTVAAPAAAPSGGGVEVCVEVVYEPSRLGDTRTQLLVSSPVGGDYVCPLFGHCMAPRPQGPILVKPGAPTTVPFKNVFGTSATFNFSVDNPAFSIKPQETIPSKKTIQLAISYKPPPTGAGYTTDAPEPKGSTPVIPVKPARRGSLGRVDRELIVSTPLSKVGKLTVSHPSGVSWVFYLGNLIS